MTTPTLNGNHTGGHMPEPSLTNFLKARIAEDEAQIAWTPLEIWPSRPRVLAETEAKRAIIAECAAQAEWDETSYTPEGWTVIARQALAKHVLLALAQPYADHPDYDETWRPE